MFLKSLILATVILVFNSCNQNGTKKLSSEKPDTVLNYSFGKLYRNIENSFRIQYPSNWELVAGEAKHTVVKFINRDSLISLSVNVLSNDGSMIYEKLSEIQLNDLKADFTSAMKSINKIPLKMNVENGFLDNHNAVITSAEYLVKQVDTEILFYSYQIQSLKDGMIYNIILNTPSNYISESYSTYLNNFIYSFRFDP